MLSRDHVVHPHPVVDEREKEEVGTLVSKPEARPRQVSQVAAVAQVREESSTTNPQEAQTEDVESEASRLCAQEAFDPRDCAGLLLKFPGLNQGSGSAVMFGLCRNQGHVFISPETERFPQCVRYLNTYLKAQGLSEAHWTSVEVIRDRRIPAQTNEEGTDGSLLHATHTAPLEPGCFWVGKPGTDVATHPELQATKLESDLTTTQVSWHRTVTAPPGHVFGFRQQQPDQFALVCRTRKGSGSVSAETLHHLQVQGFPVPGDKGSRTYPQAVVSTSCCYGSRKSPASHRCAQEAGSPEVCVGTGQRFPLFCLR